MTQYDEIDGRKQEGGNVKPVIILADRTQLFLDASLEGRDVRRHRSDFVPGAGYRVLTHAHLVYNIPEERLFVLAVMSSSLLTLNDDCTFRLGWCDAEDGGGVFHPQGHQMHLISGAAQSVLFTERCHIVPPHVFRYSENARSVTFAVTAGGAGTTISCGFAGFFMEE